MDPGPWIKHFKSKVNTPERWRGNGVIIVPQNEMTNNDKKDNITIVTVSQAEQDSARAAAELINEVARTSEHQIAPKPGKRKSREIADKITKKTSDIFNKKRKRDGY